MYVTPTVTGINRRAIGRPVTKDPKIRARRSFTSSIHPSTPRGRFGFTQRPSLCATAPDGWHRSLSPANDTKVRVRSKGSAPDGGITSCSTLDNTNCQHYEVDLVNMSKYKLNRMASSIAKMEGILPTSFYPLGYTVIFNSMVKLAGTSGLQVEKLDQRETIVYLRNKRKIQNHIGGLHACSMCLAAESATGMIVGMNVPDTHIPLIKQMNVSFVRRCQGDIRARAVLSEEDYRRINEEDRGEVNVEVQVEDESGNEPIKAEMIWAWVSKDRGKVSNKSKENQEAGNQ